MHCFYRILGEAMITVCRQQFKMPVIRLHQTFQSFENRSSGLSADVVQAHIPTGGLLGSFPAKASWRSLGAETLASCVLVGEDFMQLCIHHHSPSITTRCYKRHCLQQIREILINTHTYTPSHADECRREKKAQKHFFLYDSSWQSNFNVNFFNWIIIQVFSHIIIFSLPMQILKLPRNH